MNWSTAKAILIACVTFWGLAAIASGLSSESEWGIRQSGARLCPAGTIPDHTTYQQTVRDSDGHTSQDTVWILQCKDANGNVVKEDPNYMWPWIGIFVGAAVLLTAPVLLAVLFLVLRNRGKNRNQGVGVRVQ